MEKKLIRIISLFLLVFFIVSCSGRKEKKLIILETTDLHGVIFPFDFTENEALDASLANSASYIKSLRENSENLVLLDDGDNLQGQPTVYYYNFIDTVSPHIMPEALNYLGYDAGTTGNHDIETGHSVYDRLRKQYKFPLLAANAVDKNTGEPYFEPYTIIEKDGIRVAVLGMVTPTIPQNLPPELYSGMEFRDMVETARKWMPEILKRKPDLVVGLFHSGYSREEFDEDRDGFLNNDGSAAVAYNVPGFDIIFNGHDHNVANDKFVTANGDTVLMLNGGSRSENLAQAEITFGKNKSKRIKGSILKVNEFKPDPAFMEKFKSQEDTIHSYVDKVIGTSEATLSSRESYFGPSAFVDFIHKVQLEITGAEISFTAPLSFDVSIKAGPVRVGDMFKLYRYENMLYTMNLTGEEIKKYLEYSYSDWFNTMKNANDHLLKFRTDKSGKPVLRDGKAWLSNQPYNFDSAVGIDYTVDVSKPEGERITIKSLSGGKPFDLGKMYTVALNSYRGSGGGGHLMKGAGLSPEDLNKRLIRSTDKDLRYYIMKYIESKKTIAPSSFNNWTVIPEKWAKSGMDKDYRLLFGNDRNGDE
jgi:2',3'-cyclic-nucleotide 2'-phosphodiesterase/3'-nucleotidase